MDPIKAATLQQESFTNEPVIIPSLPSFEKVIFTPLHKDYLNVVYISNAIFALVISVIYLILVFSNDWFREHLLWLAALKIMFIALLFIISNKGFKRKGYALREKDVLFKRGLIAHKTTVIPLNRIQHVATHEGFLSRMYDLSEVQIYTAGGSSSDLSIPGLPKEEAAKIKNYLLTQIQSEVEEEEEFPLSLEKNPADEEDTLPNPSHESEKE
ncbi:MAG: PH domain-containing protein [Flavobacterium sp.]